MIRTRIVELTTLEAIAYRCKLRGGQVGLVIQRADLAQPGLATLNRDTGDADIAANVPPAHYPEAAFAEALELTQGLPYTARGKLKVVPEREAAEEIVETAEESAAVCSREYAAVVAAYTDKRGLLSYELLNKDFIQFAKSSKVVEGLVAEGASVEAIRDHVARARLEQLTGNRDLSDAQIAAIVALLDEVSPRSVFREFTAEIRKLLAR